MINKLQKAIVYLAGPLDDPRLDLQKDCKDWRNKFTQLSKINNMNIVYLDPTQKVGELVQQVEDDHKILKELQKNQKYDQLRTRMKQIVKVDLRVVDLSDAVVAMIDPDVHQCGTYHEIITAVNQKKPVFIYCPKGKKNLPRWLFGIIHHNLMYENISDIVNHFADLNSGKISMPDKWVLIRKQLHNLSKDQI